MKLFSKPQSVAKILDLRDANPAKTPRGRAFQRHWLIVPLSIALTIGAVLGTQYVVHKPAPAGQAAMKLAVVAVGRLMVLPAGENPTYGIVAEKTKLNSQTFFKNAENGDEVLIYEKAQLSILYRPSINRIVNVGPVVAGKQASPYVTSRIAILDGTGSADALAKITRQVTTAFPNAGIVVKTSASRTYPTSIVADLTKKNQPLAEQVADTLSLEGGKLPLGEPAPDADLLILVGQDYH